jgi:hypothetical protein
MEEKMRKFHGSWIGRILIAAMATSAGSLWADVVDLTANSSISRPVNKSIEPESNRSILGSWAIGAPIPIEDGLSQTTTVVANGLLYLIGGGVGPGPTARISQVLCYDPATDTWAKKASIPLPNGIAAFGSAAHLNGFIYVFGGVTGAGMEATILNTLWIYDIANDIWSQGRNLPAARFGSAVAAIQGKIIVAGGSEPPVADTTWEYDPDTDSYTVKFPLPAIASLFRIHAVTLEDRGEIHVFAGGFSGMNHWIYDYANDQWIFGRSMPVGITDPAVVTDGARIYVLGGFGPAPRGPGVMQIYDPVTRTWSAGPPMPAPGIDNTSGGLVEGTIYVLGGFDGATSSPTTYFLNVAR